MEYKIYMSVCDIIDYFYEENREEYKKFYIKIIPKEMKSIHGRYFFNNSLIEVFNLSRPYNHIITTILHEVAHHIDYCNRGKSDHSKTFYEEFYNLIIAALELNIISKNDIITETDSADKDRLEKYFGNIENWNIKEAEYKKGMKIIKVSNSYSIKEYLKNRNYKYSKLEQLWFKEIEVNNLEEEMNFLKEIIYEENIKVIDSRDLEIEAIYYIVVLNSYNYRDILKESGYIYNGYGIKKKSWNKKIKANELDKEKDLLNRLEGINMKIISQNRK
ncbi:MAG: hypothetical protein E6584_21585 [Enterobacter hormaechei]|nr:hypothetical protein [Enterobacter hormaechei]